MQIVIDMPNNTDIEDLSKYDLIEMIEYGTVLPKGHGRILDEKDILNIEKNGGMMYDLVDMPDYIADVPTIIEADRSEE